MNNKLHLRAVRHRAAGTVHPYKASSGIWTRVRPVVSAPTQSQATPLRARWSRNAITGMLECHWAADTANKPHPRMKAARVAFKSRMHWRIRNAGLRPPSRQYAHG